MNIFQYPNHQQVLRKNTEKEEMDGNVGKRIRFTIYDNKGFPKSIKLGKILSVNSDGYIVICKGKRFIVSPFDYISIFA